MTLIPADALEPTDKEPSATPPMFDEAHCISKTVIYHDNGVIRKCKLKEPTTIQGYPCERWVRFYQNGKLEQFEILEPVTLQDIDIPAKSTVFLYRGGALKKTWFSNSMTIQGLPCKGARLGKVTTSFYDNGALQWCFLTEPQTIQNIPCKASLIDIVGFHANGMLKTCTVERQVTAQGNIYTRGMKIYLDDSGKILPEL
jgi:hypothetical protein